LMIGVGGAVNATAVFSSSKIMPVAPFDQGVQENSHFGTPGHICLQQSLDERCT